MVKELKQFRRKIFYYQAQAKEYKELFENPTKLENKIMDIVKALPAFKEFFPANSQYGNIFRVPSLNLSSVSFAGLQTRNSIQQIVSSSTIGNSQQFLGSQLQKSKNLLSEQKHDLNLMLQKKPKDKLGFKSNSQKVKPFLKRFEKELNVSFGKANKFLPTSADVAFTLGYKLNDNSILGFGSSYKMGFGKGIADIQFSSQGYSLRSFLDWKLKGSIYVTGGYEKMYFTSPKFKIYRFNNRKKVGY